MYSISKQEKISLKNIGIKENYSLYLSEQSYNPESSIGQIIKNDQGFYNLRLPLVLQKEGQLFAGEAKILSWHHTEDNDLILDVFCSDQVNLCDPLHFNNLFITAKGPLLLGNEVKCSNSLVVKAQSLAVNQAVHCEQNLIVEAANGIVFLAPVVSNSFVAKSVIVYQFGRVETKAQADFSCSTYWTSHSSELVSPVFRLVADKAFISGLLHVEDKCFIVANALTLGTLDQKNKVLLAGENYIKVDSLSLLGPSRVEINAKNHASIIQVQNHLNIDSDANLKVLRATLDFNSATLKGELHCTYSQLSSNELVNAGHLHFQRGNLVVNRHYTANHGAVLTLDETHALIHEHICLDGTTNYHKSVVVGKKQSTLIGLVNITGDSSVCLTDEFNAGPKSAVKMDNSCVEVGKSIRVRGAIELNQSKLNAPIQTLEGHKLKGTNYAIFSSKQLTLSGKLDFVKGTIDASKVIIKGQINLDDARIWTDFLEIKTELGFFNKLRIQTSYLGIDGAKKPEDACFVRSVITTKQFRSKNHLTLDLTSLNLIGNDGRVQSLGDGVVLTKSRIVSKKPIIQTKDSKLSLQNNSSISAPVLLTQGEVSSEFSVLYVRRLSQIQGAFIARNSNMYIAEHFSALQSDVSLTDNSKCITPSVSFLDHTNASVSNESILLAQESVTNDMKSNLSASNSSIMTPKLTTLGSVKINHSLLAVSDLRVYSNFDVVNQSEVGAENLITAAKNSIIAVRDSQVQTRSMQTSGQMTVSDALIKVDEKITVNSEGCLVLEPGSIIMSDYLAVIGQMQVNQTEASTDKKDGVIPAQLRINNKMVITSNAKLEGNAPLVGEINEFSNFGSVNLANNLAIRGALLYNSGDIQADTVYMGYDDAVVNTGTMTARQLTIQSNFINVLGGVFVKESMNCSGLFGVNLGLICANNYSNTNLFSINSGLVLPNFSADPEYIFTRDNLFSAGKLALTSMMPGYSNLINLACMAPGVIQSVSSLYDFYENSSFEQIKNMRRHEWMPYVGQLQSFMTLGINTATVGYHATADFSNLSVKGLFSGFAVPKWSDLGLKTANVFVGSYRDSSLFHLNSGFSLAGNTSHSSLLHVNTGLETSIFSHAINTHWLYNEGILAGTECSFTASEIVNNGSLVGGASLFVSADKLTNTKQGVISGHKASVKVRSMKQEGELTLDDGVLSADNIDNTGTISLDRMVLDVGHLTQSDRLTMEGCGGKINHFETKDTASTTLKTTALQGETFDNKGQLELENVSLKYTKRFEVDSEAKVHSKNVTIDTDNFTNKGDWEYEEALVIHAKKVTLSKGSVMNGHVTNDDELFVKKDNTPKDEDKTKPAENTDKAALPDEKSKDKEQTKPVEDTDAGATTPDEKENKPDVTGTHKPAADDKTFTPKHVLILDVDELEIDGQLTGGDYTQIRGLQPEKVEGATGEAVVKRSQSVKFGDNAQVDLRYGSLQADTVIDTGHVHLDSFSLDVGHLTQAGFLNVEKSSGTISQLEDTTTATTVVSQSSIKGDFAKIKGHFDANNSSFKYQTGFELEKTSRGHTSNVSITTDSFRAAGKLDYDHYLEVNADSVVIEKSALINGEQTAEDKLFESKKADPSKIPDDKSKETTPDETNSSPGKTPETEKAKEPEKEFKPQHILSINTRKLKVDGQVTGGDYTQINGKTTATKEGEAAPEKTKCESIEISDNAKIDLKYGSILSEKLTIDGNMDLSNFSLKIDHTDISQKGHLGLVQTKLEGVGLVNHGSFDLKDSAVEMSNSIVLEKTAHERFEGSSIKTNKFIDNSQMGVAGQVAVITDRYEHDGRIVSVKSDKPETSDKTDEKAKSDVFYVDSKTARLEGESALDTAIYKVKDFDHAEALLKGEGQYSRYQFSNSLGVEVDKNINLTGTINRNCGIFAKGKSVTVNTNYTTQKDLTFISTEGAIALSGQLNAANVYGESATGMYNNATVNATGIINLKAAGEFENLGGTLNGDQVAVKAKSIKNFTRGAGHPLPVGNAGIINGRSNVFLEATDGNIENHGGMIRGGKYTQLIATGDVLNLCNVDSHWNGFDMVNDYDGGLIAGGTGVDTENVGLYIKAGGRVISDASDFVSEGINYIEGDKGLSFGARQQTYIANQWTTKKWYGKRQTHTEVATQVKGSTVHSSKGVNILRTEHGGLESVATRFSSPGGTQIYARDDVNLYSVKTTSRTYDSKSTLWGANKTTRVEYHEDAIPTLFVDNGVTKIVSSEGSVDARGAFFVGAGDLEIEAKHRIKFGCDILNHDVTEKTRSVGVSVPGMQAYNAWKNGGSWIDVATAEDASLSKINRLAHSGNTAEFVANANNLGIDLYNTSNSLMRGMSNTGLSKEMLSRYGLGGAEGFSPTITFSMTESQTRQKYQTVGAGGVDRGGNVKLKAGDGVDLENGVRVRAGGNIDIDAPELIMTAAKLQSSFDQTTKSGSVSVTPTGQVKGASYSQSKTHGEAVNYVNAELSAGGNVRLHHGDGAMKSAVLDGANITCKTMDADIKHLTITSKQDTTKSSTTSVGANTNGQVSFYTGKSSSTVTNKTSGIHVEEGINNNGHNFHVGEAYMEGGKITTNGVNNIVIDHLTTVELHDEAHTSGFGLSLNINDLGRLAGQKSTNEVGEQAIATGQFTYDHVDYKATQTSVIHGEQGTNIQIGQLDGNLHTTSADGRTVIKDEEMHLVIDIPITNASYIESASNNFKEGAAKISDFFDTKTSEELVPAAVEVKPVEAGEQKEDSPNEVEVDEKEVEDNESVIEKINFEDKEEIKPEKETVEGQKEIDELKTEVFTKDQWEKIENAPKVLESVDEVDKRSKAYKNEPNEKTKKALKDAIKHSVAAILKEASNNGWDNVKRLMAHEFETHIQKIIGPAVKNMNFTTKAYMNGKSALIGLLFNFSIVSIDGKKDIIKEAVSQTAADLVFGVAIKFAAGGASGGVSWAFVALDVFDTLFYSQKSVDKNIISGLDFLNQSEAKRHEGQYFDSAGLRIVASDKIRIASSTQAMHILATVPNKIADGFKWTWDKLPSVKSPQSTGSEHKSSYDNNRFFSPNSNDRMEKLMEEKTQVLGNQS